VAPNLWLASRQAAHRPATHNIPKPEVTLLAKKMTLYVKNKCDLKAWASGMPQQHTAVLEHAIDSIPPSGDPLSFRQEMREKLLKFQKETAETYRMNCAISIRDCHDAIRNSPVGDQEEAMQIALLKLKRMYPSTQQDLGRILRRILPHLPTTSSQMSYPTTRQSESHNGNDMEA
jgi:hypothetical protein